MLILKIVFMTANSIFHKYCHAPETVVRFGSLFSSHIKSLFSNFNFCTPTALFYKTHILLVSHAVVLFKDAQPCPAQPYLILY